MKRVLNYLLKYQYSNENIERDNFNIYHLVLHMVLLFIIQTGTAYIYVHSGTFRSNDVLQIAVRLVTWTLPVLIYLAVNRINILDYLCLNKHITRGIISGVIIGAAVIIIQLAASYLLLKKININLNIGMGLWFRAIILVGLSEELLFRGFILQKLKLKTGFGKANLIQGALFTSMHLPGWILLNMFHMPGIIRNLLFVFVMGIVMGYVLKKTNSLWACMIIHSCVNFASLCIII